FLRFVRHALGQCVQAEEQDTECHNAEDKDYGHYDHEHVGFARRRDERRQMVSCNRVDRISHAVAPTRPGHPSDYPTLAGLTKAGPQYLRQASHACAYSLKKISDEIGPKVKVDNNPHIALIIDLNQTLGSFDLAMIAR